MKNKNAIADIQIEIEKNQLKRFQEQYGIPSLQHNPFLRLKNNPNCVIMPDFYSEADGIIGEIHTHPGKLKPAQSDKVAADVLKMIMFEKDCGKELKKYLIVCSEEEQIQLTGSSNLAEAIRLFGIEVLYMPLTAAEIEKLKQAVERQDLTKV